jgi:hypothetical protein
MSKTDELKRFLEGMIEAHVKNAALLERLSFAGAKIPRFHGEMVPTLTIEQVIKHQHEEADDLRRIVERVNWQD